MITEKKEKFLTIKEVCEKYHIDASTLYRWRASGKVSAMKLGSTRVLFNEATFQRELLVLTGKTQTQTA